MQSAIRKEVSDRFLAAYRHLYAAKRVDSKKEYCKETGLPQQNFSLMEHGVTSCTVDHIYNLANKYEVSLDWLFFGKGDIYAHS